MMNFSIAPIAGAPLRNREPVAAPSTFTSVIDETLHLAAGNALDMSAWRPTATPAGSRGRITAIGDKLYENGAVVRFHVATIQPEVTFTPIPSDKSRVDAAVKYLTRQGFNAIRLMGLEHWFKHGVAGTTNFEPSRVAAFDYFLFACKREGIFWIPCAQSYNCFEDIADPTMQFNFTEPTNTKNRIYTEQGVRDNWKAGMAAIYNRVNPHTGINMMQDPAMVLLEFYNEQSTTFCAAINWPTRWLTRTSGSVAAAKTWGEWLQDASAAHGYANLAALNASWGTAHASYAAAAAVTPPAQTNAMAKTQANLDSILYCQYLENDLSTFYSAAAAEWGYPGLVSFATMYPAMSDLRGTQKLASNSVGNWHGYFAIATSVDVGMETKQADNPVWESERVMLAAPYSCGIKPVWMGEMGNHTFARWRHQFPALLASLASQGVSATSFFTQGDFFDTSYYNDVSIHGDRTRRLDNYPGPGAHVNDFVRAMQMALIVRGDVAELPVSRSFIINDRYTGISPRSTGRLDRYYSTLFQPLQLIAPLAKVRLNWADDTSDDSLAVENTKSLKQLCDDMQTAGAISGSHPMQVSVTANNGAINSVATTGTVGGLTATSAEPVMDIGSNTLINGDRLFVTNITGTGGTWPGTNSRGVVCSVLKGTGNYVQLKADAAVGAGGFNLGALSGANFTAGTWCEGANVLEGGSSQWGMSRRLKRCFVNTSKTVFFGHTNATLPATFGAVIVQVLDQDCSLFVTSLDDLSIATSKHLLIGLCGEAINTGMTYTVAADGKQTITATGNYPVQQRDIRATLSLGVTAARDWNLYRLSRNGDRSVREAPSQIDAASTRLIVSLATGTTQPTWAWELVRP